MPVYEYKCKKHGVFFELATISESNEPCACPECKELSARIIMVAPELLSMDKDNKHAHETNERNSHEPTVSSKARREEDDQHAKGCGCESGLSKSKLMYTAQGEKMFPSMRPWMISH